MNDLSREVEAMIMQFFRGKDNDDLKRIHSGYDVENQLDEETIYEIKDRIWYLLKSQHIRWYDLARKVKDLVQESDDEEEEEPETENDDD